MIAMRLLWFSLLLAATLAVAVPGTWFGAAVARPVDAVLWVALAAWGGLLLWSAVLLLGPAARRQRMVSGVVLVAVLSALLLPADALAVVGDWVARVIGRDPATIVTASVGVDKLVHFAMFLVLGAILALSRPDLARLRLVLELSAFGAATEVLQTYTPGRTASVEDWVADTLGAALGVFLARWTSIRRAGAMPGASG